MERPFRASGNIRFGVFEVNSRTRELWKNGLKAKLQEKPFQLLAALLERAGEVVTREELRQKLWSDDTFVDFDHSLNVAINKVREALEDSADTPRYVETLPRLGYRFIAPVERQRPAGILLRDRLRAVRIPALGLMALVGVLLVLNAARLREWFERGTSRGDIDAVAVLPLENISGDPEQNYLVDGMTEALITELGKIRSLRVISRQSVMRFKGTDAPLPEIARALNVDALIEGTALRIGDRVRVTVQLIAVEPERHLWAESYEQDIGNVLELQREVARTIAYEIRVTLTPEEKARLTRARPLVPEAYESYLKGQYYMEKWTPAGNGIATQYFESAVEQDPNYAPAWAGLAMAYGPLSREGREATQKALELDEGLGEAHLALANGMFYDWDWSGAEREFQRGLELAPNNAEAHHHYMHFLAAMGRLQEARAISERAWELDPLSPTINSQLGEFYLFAGEHDRAVAQLEKTVEMDPGWYPPYRFLGFAYVRKGMHEQAIAAFQKGADLGGRTEKVNLAYAYGAVGRRDDALKALQELNGHAESTLSATNMAQIYAGLGENDLAFEWLEKAYQQRAGALRHIRDSLFFYDLRSDPRFRDILARMKLPQSAAGAPR